MKIFKYLFTLTLMLVATTAMAQTDRQFIRSGNRLFRQQNYAKAETEYRKALGKNPRNTQAMYNLGCALMMQQKDSAAIEQLQRAGKSETAKLRKAKAYHNIGCIAQRHQLWGDAVKAYEECLRNNPKDNIARYNLVECKKQAKNQKQDQKKQQDKNKKQKQEKQKQDQNKQKQDKDKQQQQPKEQMSKDNAEQLLNAAMQQEKATQLRMKQAEQQPQRRRLQKNW